jgi:hypothetical protein
MANLTPIDKSVLFSISEAIERSKETENFNEILCFIIFLCNDLQDLDFQDKLLTICLQDSESFTDQQCIEQLETFISTL